LPALSPQRDGAGLLLFTEIASNAKIAKDRPKLEIKTIENADETENAKE